MELHSQIDNMSKLKITSTGKGNAGLNVKIQTNVTGNVMFPVINATSTLVIARTVDSITFPKGTKIENLELSYCIKMTELNGDLNSVINFTVPKSFAAEIVKTSLKLPQKSKVQVA